MKKITCNTLILITYWSTLVQSIKLNV